VHVLLETERMLLRRFTEADARALAALYGDPRVMRFITDQPPTRTDVESKILPRYLREYQELVAELADRGVDKPVIPGVMPVTSLASIPRMATMGAPVPDWMVGRLHEAAEAAGPDGVRRAGVELATELSRSLLEAGAPGLHFYTLNRSSATREIYGALGLVPDPISAG